MDKKFMYVNNRKVELTGNEKNLLDVAAKIGIEIPTFCYHSELSVYGACRMCMVETDKGQLIAACSNKPAPGMRIFTTSKKIMHTRRMILELLLANHHQDCTTCEKCGDCKLQDLAVEMGVKSIRFKPRKPWEDIDTSSAAIVRNPNKCILCGDCVRMCAEVQGVGVLGFVNRGPYMDVVPAFGKKLADVDCVSCGQCVSVCPTGALTVKDDTMDVWDALLDPKKKVVVQIAPAVRVAIGEEFNEKEGENELYKSVAALKLMGADYVFDTTFSADLTVLEEAEEFIGRVQKGERLPQFTSCCPGWINYAEKNCPDLLNNLSSCKSPQQMFGAVFKKYFAKKMNISLDDLYVVSVMPCTAKKGEAKRPEMSTDGYQDIDSVITTVELARMIRKMGIKFDEIEPASLDMPFGFGSGAGVIFGTSGGVAEAALRYAAEKLTGNVLDDVNFREVRGLQGIKEATVNLNGLEVNLCVVSSLSQTQDVIEKVRSGEANWHLIEVMACPGGCIGGGGQPVPNNRDAREKRSKGLYDIDTKSTVKKSQSNPTIEKLYADWLGTPNSDEAHYALHTHYGSRRRISGMEITDDATDETKKLEISVCVGTNCYLKGSYDVLQSLIALAKKAGVEDKVEFKGTFCLENCANGPSIKVSDDLHKYGIQNNIDDVEKFFNNTILPRIK